MHRARSRQGGHAAYADIRQQPASRDVDVNGEGPQCVVCGVRQRQKQRSRWQATAKGLGTARMYVQSRATRRAEARYWGRGLMLLDVRRSTVDGRAGRR